MTHSLKDRARSVLIVLAGLSSGCGGAPSSSTPDRPMDGIILNEVAEAYRFYSVQKGKPPSKLADIEKLDGLSPSGIEALKRGEVVVEWGAKLPDLGEEPGKATAPEVLAYQKQVPEKGGYILQLDRNIKKMSAEEFKTAKRAGKG